MLGDNSEFSDIGQIARKMAARGFTVTQALIKKLIIEKQQKNKDNKRLRNYMRLFTQGRTGAADATLDELKDACPPYFDPDDWKEPLLYIYFAVNYGEEDLYHWLLIRANRFERHEKLH